MTFGSKVAPSAPVPNAPDLVEVKFRYAGQGRLFVVGRSSGRLYDFWGTGAIVAVATEDASFLARVPSLTRLS